jgi:hypothetical protein
MWTEPSVGLDGAGGKQFPESFRDGPPEFFESSLDGTPFERTGITLGALLIPEEAMEASLVN